MRLLKFQERILVDINSKGISSVLVVFFFPFFFSVFPSHVHWPSASCLHSLG
jgi:hypothetical protein